MRQLLVIYDSSAGSGLLTAGILIVYLNEREWAGQRCSGVGQSQDRVLVSYESCMAGPWTSFTCPLRAPAVQITWHHLYRFVESLDCRANVAPAVQIVESLEGQANVASALQMR